MLSRLFSSCPALALGSQPGVPSAVLQHQGAVAEARNLQQLWNPPSITEKSPTPAAVQIPARAQSSTARARMGFQKVFRLAEAPLFSSFLP